MNNQLELYHQILFLDFRPWIKSSEPDNKFKQLLSDVSKEYFTYQPNYEVDFLNPLSNIRKYYVAIITHEATRFLNDLHSEIISSSNPVEIKYLVHIALAKTLSQLLQYASQTITERKYSPVQFEIGQGKVITEKLIADESYILHFLKHQLIRLYLEVQESYSENLKDDPLSEEEIYLTYYNEQAPVPSLIISADKITLMKSTLLIKKEEQKKSFNARRSDIREDSKGILSYEQIIKNPSRFAQIEEELFMNGFIDENYQFVDKHGQKHKLAAIYHQLIRKGYFNNRIFPGNKEMKTADIRKFLDHRYNVNLDKQFRTWANTQDELLKFIEIDYWLDHITSC
jgi:hypothetical protein